MTEVKVIRKFINVVPIQDLLNRTDSLVDDIYFIIDNYVDGNDFSKWTWRIYYKTALDDGYTSLLESEYDSVKEKVRLHWKPDAFICSKSGYLSIQLRASKDTDYGLAKWNTSVASINVARALNAGSDVNNESILEEYLDRVDQLIESTSEEYTEINRRLIDVEEELKKKVEASLEKGVDNEYSVLNLTGVAIGD